MTSDTLHPLAAAYLERLRRAGRGLAPGRRRELLAEIEAHLSEAIGANASDAEALTVIDRLGEPEAIVAAEAPRADELPARRGTREWAAIVLLLVGGFAFGFGWVVGLVLLWGSRAWTTRDKWIGTLVVPGGLVPGLLFGLAAFGTPTRMFCHGVSGFQSCVSSPGANPTPTALGVAGLALLVLAPIATAVYLARPIPRG